MPTHVMAGDNFATAFITFTSAFGIAYSIFQAYLCSKVKIPSTDGSLEGVSDSTHLTTAGAVPNKATTDMYRKIRMIYDAVNRGAKVFLFAEYRVMAVFIVLFGFTISVLVGSAGICGPMKVIQVVDGKQTECVPVNIADEMVYDEKCKWIQTEGSCWQRGNLATGAFVIGGLTSILSGWIGMTIAVYANARTALECQDHRTGWARGFNMAYRAGSVMGFSLCAMALIVLYVTINIFDSFIPFSGGPHGSVEALFEAIAGYGLGGSSIAMFGRVGGGIYTKAADVGADLVGKVENALDEDDPRNCATIADNVGDNVGDVAGMGADLFGSFAEATCAALVVASTSPDLSVSWTAMMYPLYISGLGIMVSFVTSLFATSPGCAVETPSHVFRNLKNQLWISTILMTPFLALITWYTLPQGQFCIKMAANGITCVQHTVWWKCFVCAGSGLWGGLVIGLVTEYMTSYEHRPTQEVAESTVTGAATNIIFGLALGYKSVIIPIFVLAITCFMSFTLGDMYGIALAALGMLSTLAVGLSIDAYGPITDNAGGFAEMARMPQHVRERTDVLDAAGNTTAAIGKGFAIGSAALVSLALFGAFVTRAQITEANILKPITFSGLLVGAMLPYWFTAMTMKSVGMAAKEMVECVRASFHKNRRSLFKCDKQGNCILDGAGQKQLLEEDSPEYIDPMSIPNFYDEPVDVSTRASLREMILPGALVMGAPVITGFLFGVNAVTGLLAGGMTSGVQMAISQSNTGGAWDNAKKYIEKGELMVDQVAQGKGSECHKAAVIGDTVGDPLKDTSGPALNILMKLMAIISLVFAPFFVAHSICLKFNTC